MKVILKQDVARLGRQFDVVSVADGYANNFLFPQKLAEFATTSKIEKLEDLRKTLDTERETQTKKLKESLEKLDNSSLTITVKTDDQGNLYKKLNVTDILEELKKEFKIEIPETAIPLESPINKIGETEVPVEAAGMKITLTIKVESENENVGNAKEDNK